MDIIEPAKKKEFENVLPLVNIVFLLLIFFMISGTFIRPEALKIDAPSANLFNPISPEKITIVMSQNQYSIGDRIYNKSEVIKFIQAETNKEKNPSVQLKVDNQVHSIKLLTLMQELGSIGISSIHLLTIKH